MATRKSEKPPASKAAVKTVAKKAPAQPAAAKKTASAKKTTAAKPLLLSGDNPQIAKADGGAPVQAYIAAVPADWRGAMCARLDALIVANLPGVHKAVRWNSPFYGFKGQGWFLGFHIFAKFIKVSFFQGASLTPPPTGGTDVEARWINIHEGGLDEVQMADWIRQAAALPGWGKN